MSVVGATAALWVAFNFLGALLLSRRGLDSGAQERHQVARRTVEQDGASYRAS
jgi:hypothetical protein